MNKTLLIIILIIIFAGVGGGGFYAGIQYNKSQSTNRFANFQGTRNGNFNAQNTRPGIISGSIVSKDDNSITLQLQDGSSKIIFYSETTQIGKFETGTAEDLFEDQTITVNGTTNPDGSTTAQSIQIRPAGQDSPGLVQ
ncbi:MAG: hypothetical protein ABH832_01945 [bacterium]